MNILQFDLEKAISESNISITELSKKLGVTRQTVYYYLKQGNKLPLVTINEIISALDLPNTNDDNHFSCPNCGASLKIEKG